MRGASVKPEAAYEEIETLVPDGHYIEIFARRHNVRPNWISIGNQLKG